jgi:hypothetical protein
MLYIVAPLYAAYNLFVFIFTIVFSDKGLKSTASDTAWEGATLAQNMLLLLFYFATALAILFLSVNKANWDLQGGAGQPGMFLGFRGPNC